MAAKLGIPMLYLFSVFFVALSNNLNLTIIPEQITFPHPLCRSQIALVNFACVMVLILPLPPPPVDGDEHARSHRHKHQRRHRHRHRIRETPEQCYCCEWLRQIDPVCVCEILLRLPPFLWKPNHEYTVVVDENCSVTYACNGQRRI